MQRVLTFRGKVVAYAYLLNGLSDTYGVRVSGKPELVSNFRLGFWAEFAYQRDPTLTSHEIGDRKIGAYYYNLNLRPTYRSPIGNLFLEAGYEFMGGADADESAGFTTPLATLHAMNGWADAFVKYSANTSTYGLVNPVLGAGLKSKKFGKLWVRYHIFKADKSFPGGGKKAGLKGWVQKPAPLLSPLLKFYSHRWTAKSACPSRGESRESMC